MTPESVDAVHIADQRLQTFIRHADNELKIHFSCIFQTDGTPLLIHLGKCLVQKYQLDFGIPVALLHVQHCKTCQKCHIFRVLPLSTGISSCHIIDKIFTNDIPLLVCHLFKHAEGEIIAVICVLLHLLTLLRTHLLILVPRRHEFISEEFDLLLIFLIERVLPKAQLTIKTGIIQIFTV